VAIRPEVQALIDLGPFPESSVAEEHHLRRIGELLDGIARPVNREEAECLMKCFGPDDCFGLAWTLLHLIETTPDGVPLSSKPPPWENKWIRDLWERSHR
jgi:hypothetical protein